MGTGGLDGALVVMGLLDVGYYMCCYSLLCYCMIGVGLVILLRYSGCGARIVSSPYYFVLIYTCSVVYSSDTSYYNSIQFNSI